MSLESIGFKPGQVHRVSVVDDRIIVPAVIGDFESSLMLATGDGNDVILDLSHAKRMGLKTDDLTVGADLLGMGRPGRTGYAMVGRFEILGRALSARRVRVADLRLGDSAGMAEVAGLLGARFFSQGVPAVDSVLGIDHVSCRVAAADDPFPVDGQSQQPHRVPLLRSQVDQASLAFTKSVSDAFLWIGAHPMLQLDTAARRSVVSVEYLRRGTRHRFKRFLFEFIRRRGGVCRWFFRLPDAKEVAAFVKFATWLPPTTEPEHLEPVDGIVGIDVLKKWICVFDFRRGELLLFER
jgi:hypothetical protein